MNFIINSILERNYFKAEKTFIEVDYFINKQYAQEYNQNGYTIVRGIVEDNLLNEITNTYNSVKSHKSYYESDDFLTTPNFGKELHEIVQSRLAAINNILIPKIFDTQCCIYNLSSILVIKSFKNSSHLVAHQDSSFVDERKGSTSFLWIPVEDINNLNGAITVLPGSHKWARWQKTHSRDISPLLINNIWLTGKMTPVFLKKGDILIFDSSLIHSSLPNKSSSDRIAMNTAVVPNNTDLVHYSINTNTPKGYEDKFYVNGEFWSSFEYIKEIPEGKYKKETEKLIYYRQLSVKNLEKLIRDN